MSLNDYLRNSSVHGLHYVSKTEKTASRIIWCLALLTSCAWGVHIIYDSFYAWETAPHVTNIQMIDVKEIPFPDVIIRTSEITTKWRAISHILKQTDTEGEIWNLFRDSRILNDRIKTWIEYGADFYLDKIYLKTLHTKTFLDPQLEGLQRACKMKSTSNWKVMQKFFWITKLLDGDIETMDEHKFTDTLYDFYINQVNLRLEGKVLDRNEFNVLDQDAVISKCRTGNFGWNEGRMFKIALNLQVLDEFDGSVLIDILTNAIGSEQNNYMQGELLRDDSNMIAKYMENQSKKLPGLGNDIPIPHLVYFWTFSGNEDTHISNLESNKFLNYSLYASRRKLEAMAKNIKACHIENRKCCDELDMEFKSLDESLLQNISYLSHYGTNYANPFEPVLIPLCQALDGNRYNFSCKHAMNDPFAKNEVQFVIPTNGLEPKPTGSLALAADLSYFFDSSIYKGFYLSVQKSGVIGLDRDLSLDVTVYPDEFANIEVDVEVFVVSDAIKKQPLKKRDCIIPSDDDFKLTIFEEYGMSNCKIEKAMKIVYKEVLCLPTNFMILPIHKLTKLLGTLPKVCSLGKQILFNSKVEVSYKNQNCLRSCSDINYTLRPRRTTDLASHLRSQKLQDSPGSPLFDYLFPDTWQNAMHDKIVTSNNYGSIYNERTTQIAIMNLKFGKQNYHKIETSLKASNNDKLALIGGTLGLFTGISFVSIFEVVFWLLRALKRKVAILSLRGAAEKDTNDMVLS